MKFKFTKKTIIIIVAIVAIGVFGYTLLQRQNAAKRQEDALAAMKNSTVPVSIRDIENTIYTSGQIKAKEAAVVLTDTSGIVSEILVSAGDEVEKDQIIAKLEVADLIEQIEQQELAYEIDKNNYLQAKLNAEDAYEDAEKDLEEKQALYAVDSISRNELDNAREALEDAEQELKINTDDAIPTSLEIKYLTYKRSEISLNNLYQELSDSTIKSPINGIVTAVNTAETDYVNAKSQLFEVANLKDLEIIATVGEYEVNELEIGMKAMITGDAFRGNYNGTISNIAAAATKSGSETVVEIVINLDDETDELKPNFTANADIVIASVQGALAVPLDAVVKMDGNSIVRVKNGETITPVKVETGVEDDLYIQIISDEINEGDQVISGANMGSNGGMRPNGMFGGGPRGGR